MSGSPGRHVLWGQPVALVPDPAVSLRLDTGSLAGPRPPVPPPHPPAPRSGSKGREPAASQPSHTLLDQPHGCPPVGCPPRQAPPQWSDHRRAGGCSSADSFGFGTLCVKKTLISRRDKVHLVLLGFPKLMCGRVLGASGAHLGSCGVAGGQMEANWARARPLALLEP